MKTFSKIKKSGLTLVEGVIVTMIVLLLATVSLVILSRSITKAKNTPGCSTNLKQIGLAYSLYEQENDGQLPRWGLVTEPGSFSLNRYCPLTKMKYSDTYMKGVLEKHQRLSEFFPDGTPIPHFDPTLDVLAKCMSHGYEGFDNKGSRVAVISPEIHGKVLGVRLDGSVTKVNYMSCFEYAMLDNSSLRMYKDAVRTCDRLHD